MSAAVQTSGIPGCGGGAEHHLRSSDLLPQANRESLLLRTHTRRLLAFFRSVDLQSETSFEKREYRENLTEDFCKNGNTPKPGRAGRAGPELPGAPEGEGVPAPVLRRVKNLSW